MGKSGCLLLSFFSNVFLCGHGLFLVRYVEGVCILYFPCLPVEYPLVLKTLSQSCNADLIGHRWQHSREMLRPNFVRTQIGDVEMLENHVRHLIQAIPKDGSSVHLQDLFYKFSMDVATDLLFGESTNTLAPDFVNAEVSEFVDAYGYSLQVVGGALDTNEKGGFVDSAFGFVKLFLPNRKLKQQIEVVNSTFIQHSKPCLSSFKQQ